MLVNKTIVSRKAPRKILILHRDENSVTHLLVKLITSHDQDYQLQNEFGVANK